MQKIGVTFLICLAAITAGSGRAQQATPAAPAVPSGATIRVTTTEVALDLVVRDKKGRQVKNLKPGDVEIYEDGVRQQILSFRMVAGREQQRRDAKKNPSEGSRQARPCRCGK